MHNNPQFTTDIIIQYTIVGLILLAVCVWIIWKLTRKRKNTPSNSCCGCAIADSCKKAKNKPWKL
ncbi:MAG: FeoB-associated Cys-rich membrane protein [Muribaculaceae bacterium]|nr:FeoB-associated Cys-rich membrane protein [Muribaculaceae bacterium]